MSWFYVRNSNVLVSDESLDSTTRGLEELYAIARDAEVNISIHDMIWAINQILGITGELNDFARWIMENIGDFEPFSTNEPQETEKWSLILHYIRGLIEVIINDYIVGIARRPTSQEVIANFLVVMNTESESFVSEQDFIDSLQKELFK